jgi:hypothetical protein
MPPDEDPPPPVLGSWARVYTLVLGMLAFWIIVFALFTASYRSVT